MPQYQAPLRDMNFVLHELLDVQSHYRQLPVFADTDRDTLDSVLALAAKFNENVLSPINRSGDEEGCLLQDGQVRTPTGFKEAYVRFTQLGLGALAEPASRGGLGLPATLATACNEMIGGANRAWGMYPCLNHGAIKTLVHHGSAEQQQTYLQKLVAGEWLATMCLTEPQAGSDLGLVRTRAEPQADGSYAISGSKMFISGGDHDFTDNIVHIVLARLPEAPAGTKGISLFLVPKFKVEADGTSGARNRVQCGSLEHKMGLKGSATCVMNFDAATGFLIGQPHKGLSYMFLFMNSARLGVALQGVAGMEASSQAALRYARERLASRALSGPQQPQQPADPIIVHPAVRQMLLTQKAFTEGGRALVYWLAMQEDILLGSCDSDARRQADALLSLMTPIAKAVLTELGLEVAKHGIQVYGGHGFIREWGMEQMERDARVATLYEGTTEIQALDLLGRKVLATQGQSLQTVLGPIRSFCDTHAEQPELRLMVSALRSLCTEWEDLTRRIGLRALGNADEVGAAAVDYLYFAGYVMLGWFWARMAAVAVQALAAGSQEADFYQAKLHTARFYFSRLLPRTRSHVAAIDSGLEALMPVRYF